MGYTESDKQSALAWAEGLTMSHKSDHAEFMAQKLAACLRQADIELELTEESLKRVTAECQKAESALAAHISHDRCNAGMRSRIKTLEAENAALREALDTQRVFLTRLDSLGDLGQMVHEAIRAEIENIGATLPPAGEEKKCIFTDSGSGWCHAHEKRCAR